MSPLLSPHILTSEDVVIQWIEVIYFKEIMAYGIMKTPALVVDEKIKIMGRVPSPDEIKKYL